MKTPKQFAKLISADIVNLPELKYKLNHAELINLSFILNTMLTGKLVSWEGEIKNAGKEKQ